jgi:hypothetical protein
MESSVSHVIFDITTALGMRVSLDEGRWKVIVGKHHDMEHRVDDVRDALLAPDTVRYSRYDATAYLYYRRSPDTLFTCVVLHYEPGRPTFIVTAYRTDAIKAGVTAR